MRHPAHKDVRRWQLHLRRKLKADFTLSERHRWLVLLKHKPALNRDLARKARAAEWLDRHDRSGWVRWQAWANYWAAASNPVLAALYRWTAQRWKAHGSTLRESHAHRRRTFVAIEQLAAPPAH